MVDTLWTRSRSIIQSSIQYSTMASCSFSYKPCIFLIIAFFASLTSGHQNPLLNIHRHIHEDIINNSNTNTMFMPIFYNNHHHNNNFRRILRNGSKNTARMSLYDDLITNGYYTTCVWIGTPPQRFSVIVDTGSTITYVPCSTCTLCGKHQDPKFQPQLSRTYKPVKCNAECTCDKNKQCTYQRDYAEGSVSSGILGKDMLSFGNKSGLEPQRAVFGCENMETGGIYSQVADGIMGLGRGDFSIVDQLVDNGAISNSFSICYGGMDVGGGAMALGGISPPSDMVFSRSDPLRSSYYNLELREIHVAGKMLPVSPKVFDGKQGTVLDSGTTYAYFPEAAFVAFKEAISKEVHSLKQIPGPDPRYEDICFSGASSSQLSKTFPSVEMVFTNGQKLLLSPENYLFKHSKVRDSYCLGVFQNEGDPTTLLGGIIVRNTLVTYDREHEKIGFWKTNCSELWERLHSPETGSHGHVTDNSTVDMAPTPARSESPLNKDSGHVASATGHTPQFEPSSNAVLSFNDVISRTSILVLAVLLSLWIV